MPSSSEITEAITNQAKVRRPTRPSAAVSPMCAMPTTSVENTSGAMIILIRRRKTSVTIEKYPPSLASEAGSVTFWWRSQPTTTPRAIAARM